MGFFFLSNSAQLTEQNAAQVLNMCIHGERFIEVETKGFFLTDWEKRMSQPEMDKRQELESQKEHLICEAARNGMKDLINK